MGTYIYTLRSQTINIEELGKANLLKYLFKPLDYLSIGGPTEKWERAFAMQIVALENRWYGREMPKYVVVGDKFEDGAPIYTYGLTEPLWYDCEKLGECVGYLNKRKVGRKVVWSVRTREQQELIERCKLAHQMDLGKADIKLNGTWGHTGDEYLAYCNKKDKEHGSMVFQGT